MCSSDCAREGRVWERGYYIVMFEKIFIYTKYSKKIWDIQIYDVLISSTILQNGTPSSILYVPPPDAVIVVISPTPPSPNECDKVTPSDMNCSFTTTNDTMYTVVVYVNNSFGLSPNDTMTFDCKF